MYDIKLEQTIAEILFHNQDLLDADLVEPADFFTDLKDAVKRMIKLRKNTNLLNETTVGRRFDTPTAEALAQFEDLVNSLKSLNRERKLQFLGDQIRDIAIDSISYTDKMMKIRKIVESFEHTPTNIDDYLVSATLEEYKEKLFSKSKEDLLPTGIYELDLRCGQGFKPGELVLIAGEPGGFKSTLLYNMALNIALSGESVMLFTYEVGGDELKEILCSMLAGVDSIALRTRAYKPSDIPKMQKAFKVLETLPLHVIDNNATLDTIRLSAYQKKPAIVLIDYLQIMPDMGTESVKALEYITRQLKLMANPEVLNCPIVAVSQFNRSSTDRDGQSVERKMSDLKGSSSLEQNAAIVMFTKHIQKQDRTSTIKNSVEIKIEKNRHGVKGILDIPIIPPYHRLDCKYVAPKKEMR